MWRWSLRWRRARFEWEFVLEAELVILFSTANLIKDKNDVHVWRNDEAGGFSMNSAYECLSKHGRGLQLDVFKYLWKAKAFPSVVTTTWRVLVDRLPTRECLSRRGVMTSSTLCDLCQAKEEYCQHLFLECNYAIRFWSMCFRWICILFVQHNDMKSHFESFHLFQVSHSQNLVWKGVWTTVVKSIWDHRNSVVFKQGVVDAEEIFQKAQIKSWLGMKHKSVSFNYSQVDWILNPMLCIRSHK